MRILVVDPYMPLFDTASGYRRLLEVLRILISLGNEVSFVACEGRNQERYAAVLRDMGIDVYAGNPDGLVEAGNLEVQEPSGNNTDLANVLQSKRYDAVVFSYYHTAELYLGTIRQLAPQVRVLIDTVDVHFVREQREAWLHRDPELYQQAVTNKRRELAVYSEADALIAVTDVDRLHLLAELPRASVHVLPNIHEVAEHVPPWGDRDGLLFVGNFHHRPNRDAVRYLCQQIMPCIWCTLKTLSLTIAGFAIPNEVEALAERRIIIAGHVPDMMTYLRSHRISVAPLRFGAGLKGKIGESLAAGTPVVTTSIGAEGMPLAEGYALLAVSDDVQGFADAVTHLYQNESIWNALSKQGQDLVRRYYSPAVVAETVNEIFSSAS